MGSFGSTNLEPVLRSGDRDPIRGWIAPDYGQREPAPALVLTATAFLPQRILTLMIPDPSGSSTPPEVNTLFDAEGLPVGVAFDSIGRVGPLRRRRDGARTHFLIGQFQDFRIRIWVPARSPASQALDA